MRTLFYQPREGFVGDVIPYYENGIYYIFYLHAHRNIDKYGEGTSWYLLTTKDFIHYEEHGEVLVHGNKEQQDLNAFTGSVCKKEGIYYLYYTGYNAHEPFYMGKEPMQAVMLASSTDLVNWEKKEKDILYASEVHYELSDWRDPYVFYNEEKKEYWMLLAARQRLGAKRRRGCVGLCTSKDLDCWEAKEALYAPGLYMTHECPEMFQIGEWWYLIYSSFSERFATHYRMSKSSSGPFWAPVEDTFDGRGFYAGRTASEGNRRYLIGWTPTRKDESDYGDYEWAGTLVVHELVQREDGTLYAKIPDTVGRVFDKSLPFTFHEITKGFQDWYGGKLQADTAFDAVVSEEELPVCCKIRVKFHFEKGTRSLGILLRSDGEAETCYSIRLEPDKNRMVFDMWPRKIKDAKEDTWEINGDVPYFIELERYCLLEPYCNYELTILLDDNMGVVYLHGQTAMSFRTYNLRRGKLGVFVSEGNAEFYDMEIKVKSADDGARI